MYAAQACLDGELCAVRPDGTTSFANLQGHGDTPAALVFFAFDLLHLDGEDLIRLRLLERKARLEALLRARRPCDPFQQSCDRRRPRASPTAGSKLGLEGMVSKAVDKPYVPGNRGIWVKTKVSQPAGIRDRRLDRSGRLALLGSDRCCSAITTDDGKLIYAGRAGTGMTDPN